MIDTHAHLNFPALLGKIDEVVEKSKKVGLTGIVVASSNLQDSEISVGLAKKYSGFLYASVGIHPQNILTVSQLVQLDQLVKSNRDVIVAIGETGLDFSEAPHQLVRGKAKPSGQEELFLGQIKLTQKYGLPLIVHAREANDEIIEILSNEALRGVFHCYSGGKKRISKILDLPGTWFFGFDGNLTYDEGLQQIIKLIPEERIVVETDSPFLAPLPHRGEINTPVYLPLIQQKINEIFGRDLTSQILKNSQNLFKI